MNWGIQISSGEYVEAAAVGDQRRAGDEAGLVRSQETDRGGDVLRLTDCALDLFHAALDVGIVPEHGSIHRPGRNAIDANLFRSDFFAESARKRLHAALGGCV